MYIIPTIRNSFSRNSCAIASGTLSVLPLPIDGGWSATVPWRQRAMLRNRDAHLRAVQPPAERLLRRSPSHRRGLEPANGRRQTNRVTRDTLESSSPNEHRGNHACLGRRRSRDRLRSRRVSIHLAAVLSLPLSARQRGRGVFSEFLRAFLTKTVRLIDRLNLLPDDTLSNPMFSGVCRCSQLDRKGGADGF